MKFLQTIWKISWTIKIQKVTSSVFKNFVSSPLIDTFCPIAFIIIIYISFKYLNYAYKINNVHSFWSNKYQALLPLTAVFSPRFRLSISPSHMTHAFLPSLTMTDKLSKIAYSLASNGKNFYCYWWDILICSLLWLSSFEMIMAW